MGWGVRVVFTKPEEGPGPRLGYFWRDADTPKVGRMFGPAIAGVHEPCVTALHAPPVNTLASFEGWLLRVPEQAHDVVPGARSVAVTSSRRTSVLSGTGDKRQAGATWRHPLRLLTFILNSRGSVLC